jgi:hypothetical protein
VCFEPFGGASGWTRNLILHGLTWSSWHITGGAGLELFVNVRDVDVEQPSTPPVFYRQKASGELMQTLP